MSKLIATRAIQGAHRLVARADRELHAALQQKLPGTPVKFPNTAYYLPISYGMLGMKIETLAGLQDLLDEAKRLLPVIPADELWLPFLGDTLDAGMATLFADEIIEKARAHLASCQMSQMIFPGPSETMGPSPLIRASSPPSADPASKRWLFLGFGLMNRRARRAATMKVLL